MNNRLSQKEAFEIATRDQFAAETIRMGPWTSYSLLDDPKHMCFVLSRYKFCAKLLEGKAAILEIGCGDGFGAPILAQAVDYVLEIDVDERLIHGNRERLNAITNMEFKKIDICEQIPERIFDAVVSIDVIEHLESHLETSFMENSCACLDKNGIFIMGTPNITAEKHATDRSTVQHINLKSHLTLRSLLSTYFTNVFIFSMNDEVVHTGYGPMAHYLFGVGVGKKEESQ